MKFRCERDVLFGALEAAQRGVGKPTGGTLALAGVHIRQSGDTVWFTGSNLELAVQAEITATGDFDGTAVAVAPARLLVDIVRSLPPGAVHAEDADNVLHVSSGRASFDVRCFPADDYPRFDWPDEDPAVTSAKELVEGFGRVVPAASTDDSRPILCAVQLESRDGGLRIVGTDSYRLFYTDLDGVALLADTEKALVPAAALAELIRLVKPADNPGTEIETRIGKRAVSFTAGPLRVWSQLVEGDFPNYGGLIPSESSRRGRLTANRRVFADALKQARVLARESTPVRVQLGISPEPVLKTTTQDVGLAEIIVEDGSYDGEAMTVAFNPWYLGDALECAPGDVVRLDVIDGRKPAILRVESDDHWTALLMPVRVS